MAKLLEKNEYLDSLTYASLPKEIRTLTSDPRLSFNRGSIVYEKIIGAVVAQEPIVHFAAESYADNSIQKGKFGEYNFDANKVASFHSLRPLIQ
ncbi:hypothetical protein [Peribacillus sp. NPDC056705]|uniref:hypothetical protein n=1 Tax=Peribacillus sp. NPDC056705 TaxID=3345918 RepID=UPI003749F514